MRILITYPFPLGRATGGARMTREIARHLGRAGARVTVLPVSAGLRVTFPRYPVEEEHLGLEFDEGLARDGVDVRRVPPHRLHAALDALAVKKAVRRIVESEPVDAVLSYYGEGAFLPTLLSARGVRHGYISTWQSYAEALRVPIAGLPRSLAPRFNEHLIAEPYRRADVLFATSRFTKDELVSVLGVEERRVSVCPLGVRPHFAEIPRAAPEAIRRLLFFGRVIPSKGVADALAALGELAREGAEFRFDVVGQGNHEWARGKAREHGIEERVHLHGPAGDEELVRFLSEAHLAILPSHFEAFGLAFAEAQAAGLPVVAYGAGSVPEVVEDGVTGWLAPTGDVAALAAAIRGALADPAVSHAAGLAGRERVRRLFTWERTAEVILGGVARVCGRELAAEAELGGTRA